MVKKQGMCLRIAYALFIIYSFVVASTADEAEVKVYWLYTQEICILDSAATAIKTGPPFNQDT